MKTVNTKITCDTCGADLSPKVTSYPHNYILRLTVEDVAIHQEYGIIYDIMQMPPLKHDLYFCERNCMKKYGDEK